MYCRATDSESGHYTCGSSGEKVCLEGWTNPTQHCLTRELYLIELFQIVQNSKKINSYVCLQLCVELAVITADVTDQGNACEWLNWWGFECC